MLLRDALLLISLLTAGGHGSAESFSETLELKPLADGKVYAHFTFTTLVYDTSPRGDDTLVQEDTNQHYLLFPLALGQLLRAQAVTELHLNLNAGKWDYDLWGYPHDPGVGSGAELWAWFAENDVVSSSTRWKDLANGLSGLFCASIGALHESRMTRPLRAFSAQGDLLQSQEYALLHAFLPSETICTENLTPFLKLLPCKGRSGLASLLNPHYLFDASWHGIGVHVTWKEGLGIESRLTFGAVLDPVRTSQGRQDWSLSDLFGKGITPSCPVASESAIVVTLPSDTVHVLTPAPDTISSGVARFNATSTWDIAMTWPGHLRFVPEVTPTNVAVTARRVLTGGSQTNGGFFFELVNHQDIAREIICYETAPWFINVYLHTRKITVDGLERGDIVITTSYTLPRDHQPTVLETVLLLPANSTTRISMSFSKSFIAYTEHPPDAERGWDLPPAVISFVSSEDPSEPPKDIRIYTKTLLIDLPTPDFSMPYNVIIMSSTVIALFFGSIFNLLTRKFKWVKTNNLRPSPMFIYQAS